MNITATSWADFFTGGIHYADILNSTQDYLNDQPRNRAPQFCCASQQSAGYGQRGRVWQSPLGNLYCSLRLAMNYPPAAQSGLAQYIALILAETLDSDAQKLRLKWPNDLWTKHGKCGGILIDNVPYESGTLSTIGIGLNLINADAGQGLLARDIHPSYHSVAQTLDIIMPPLISALCTWSTQPYLPITHRWQDYDPLCGQIINLEGHPESLYFLGIDQKGRLMGRDTHGLHFLSHVRIQVKA